MRRYLLMVFLVSIFMGFVLSPVFGGDAFSPNGNDRKGKYLYRKTCRKCHDGSKAKELSPSSKTMAEWKQAFENYKNLKCKDEWQKLKHKDLNDIFSYLYNHAYDSPQPATCG